MTCTTLAELCEHVPDARLPAGAGAVCVGRVRDDSRQVEPDDLFVAVRGTSTDGAAHIDDAISRGAAAVVVQDDGNGNAETGARPGRGGRDVPVIRVENARVALALLAAAAFRHPARRLDLVGITGTVGKTSVLAMLAEILDRADIDAGTIGSLGIRFTGRTTHNPNTTPGALILQEALCDMADAGVSVAAMEVTSHALIQERIYGLRYDLGIFTNLTLLEHMEYHGSFRSYAEAKLRFLDHLTETAPLVHAAGDRAVRQTARRHPGPRVSCGGGAAWVGIRRESLSLHGTRLTLAVRRPLPRLDGSCLDPCTVPIRLRTLGRPNIINATLAATAGLIVGAAPDVVQQALADVEPPKRRLEVVRARAPILIDDTVGHPDSITGVFELAERVPHRELRAVFCVRGKRGELINARDAEALAIWARRVRIASLHITSAEDTADERNRVSGAERRAFVRVLESESVPHVHHLRLEDAIAAALTGTAADDLVLLLGAQGMDAGAAIARRLLPGDRGDAG